MLAAQALEKGLVARMLPVPNLDSQNVDVPWRVGRYNEGYVLSLIRKHHLLADEGSYFVFNNAQSGITGQTNTSYTATAPTISIYNGDIQGNVQSRRVYLDYIHLLNGSTAFSNATSNTGTFLTVVLDTQDGVTGGTLLSPANPNQDATAAPACKAIVRVGALTAPALTAAAQTIIGQRLIRLPVSSTALTLANVDQFHFNFGGVEAGMALPNQASATLEAYAVGRVLNLPPVVIGPGQSAFIYVVSIAGGAVTAGNFLPEIGLFMR